MLDIVIPDIGPMEMLTTNIATNTILKESNVNIVLPTSQNNSNVDVPVSNGQLTTVVSPSQAFQVLNHDFLAPVSVKPNAIVHPLRRDDPMNDHKLIAYVESQIVKNDEDDFTKELNKKLRRLRKDNNSKSSSKNGSNQESICKRPLFITTVPKGIFLEPPIEFKIPSKRVYAYSSKPRIFANHRGHAKDKHHTSRNDKDFLKSLSGARTFAVVSSNEREAQAGEPYKNLMHDKRVVRGSNFSQSQTIALWNPYFAYAGLLSGKGGEGDCSKEAEARRRNLLRKRVVRNQRGVIGTPPPVCGRKHEDVQTDKYLEELFEKPPEIEVGCQTDLFLQRPPSPPYVPSKIGVDVSTEILEGELFDFNTEVEPLLESIVGYSVEQGLIEVLHEEELADINAKQQELLALREADLAELRRLEAEEVRLQAEKDRRLRQDEITKELDLEMQDKVTAARLLQGHIANLVPAVLRQLEPLNEAENREELERKLCPWLTQQVAEEVGHMIDSREVLTAIVREILLQRAEMYDPTYVPSSPDEKFICEEIREDEGISDESDGELIETEDEEVRTFNYDNESRSTAVQQKRNEDPKATDAVEQETVENAEK